jgi:hypothetical protein
LNKDDNDSNWTIHNDLQSVTVGINTRIWLLRRQKMVPTLIRLGRKHTRLFLREAAMQCIPNKKPRRIYHQGLVWDDVYNRLGYGRRMIPFQFNDRSIHGIVVEGKPR